MGTKIFISYATVDGASYRVPEIAKILMEDPSIDKTFFWEQDAEDDIMDYMNKNLTQSEIVILFCSPNVVNSAATEMEWKSALKLNKQIIPVFVDPKYIPALVTAKIGVQFTPDDFNGFIVKLKDQIYRRSRLVQQAQAQANKPAEVHKTFEIAKYKPLTVYQGAKQLVLPKSQAGKLIGMSVVSFLIGFLVFFLIGGFLL